MYRLTLRKNTRTDTRAHTYIHTRNKTKRVVICREQTVKTKYNKVPVVRDAGATEVAVRPMDDVCPWESAPGPSTEHGADAVPSGGTASADQARHVWDSGGHATIHTAEASRVSRKNSAQLDSCSSSSDVSLAIAEVSERLRKSCSLQHSGSIGRFAIAVDERKRLRGARVILHLVFFPTGRYSDFRPRPDNAKLFHLFGERSYQAVGDESRVRVILQLSVASSVIRVLLPCGRREGGREIGKNCARGGHVHGIRRR